MMMNHSYIKYGVGLDLSEADVEAALAVMDSQGNVKLVARRSFANRAGGFKALQGWLVKQGLTRQHQSLRELRTQLGNQLHAHSRSIYRVGLVQQQLMSSIAGIDGQLKELEVAITTHLQSDSGRWRKVQHLQSIKGVGLLCVAVLLAETNGFGLMSSARQLVSYAGYDVVENQSGSRRGKTRISKKGNGRIRRILHLPALNVVRFQGGVFADLFERTYARHGIKMKSYVAVQKKLLTILYSLWSNEEAFDPDYRTPANPEEQTAPEQSKQNEQIPKTKTAPTVTDEAAEGRLGLRIAPKTPVKLNSKKSGA